MPMPAPRPARRAGSTARSTTCPDTLGTLRALAPMWEQTIEGVDADVLAHAPGAGGVVGRSST